MQQGVDYFVSRDEIVAFCKERDDIRNQNRAAPSNWHMSETPTNCKRSRDEPISQRVFISNNRSKVTISQKTFQNAKKRPRERKERLSDNTTKKSNNHGSITLEERCQDVNLTIDSFPIQLLG
jgi:hypothetical protein